MSFERGLSPIRKGRKNMGRKNGTGHGASTVPRDRAEVLLAALQRVLPTRIVDVARGSEVTLAEGTLEVYAVQLWRELVLEGWTIVPLAEKREGFDTVLELAIAAERALCASEIARARVVATERLAELGPQGDTTPEELLVELQAVELDALTDRLRRGAR